MTDKETANTAAMKISAALCQDAFQEACSTYDLARSHRDSKVLHQSTKDILSRSKTNERELIDLQDELQDVNLLITKLTNSRMRRLDRENVRSAFQGTTDSQDSELDKRGLWTRLWESLLLAFASVFD